ncbi:M4 family metallopeptidase [Thalassotalea fusca]
MKTNYISLAVAIALSTASSSALAADTVKATTYKGTASFSAGKLGEISKGKLTSDAIRDVLSMHSTQRMVGNESFSVRRQWSDKLGKSHVQVRQHINGLPVYGTTLTIHSESSKRGLQKADVAQQVYAVSGVLAKNPVVHTNLKSLTSDASTIAAVSSAASAHGEITSEPQKVYVYLPLTEETKLAWKVEVTWNNGGEDFGRDDFFYDAGSVEQLTRHAKVHSAKNWKTYDLQNQDQNAAPGVLKCTNSQVCNDASAQRAHDGASKVYDYYLARFGRDSINGSGMTMVSSVHLGNNVGNAYWTGSQMMYGDGDGSTLADLTLSFDVIGHELTHGVTQYTANLVYNNASGALNEAWSDIMGVAALAYKNNTTTADWKLAEESYTPNTPGDAMRYMDNPTADNYSKDWWPERIPYESNPTRFNDYGGVHGNSGIANLAFALLVDGGTHPRNKSTAVVPSVGLLKAEQIFYRALTTYMNSSTDFAGARTATKQAATDLYGATEATAVETAWCAVGVGTCPTGPVTGPETLENGVAKTNISGAAKQEFFYTLDVPAGATDLKFTTTGGTGDADLYVKFGSAPTLSSSDCKSTTSTSNETCSISNVQAGKYHVMVQAWNQINGASLTGSFKAPTGGLEPIDVSATASVVNYGSWARYTYQMPANYSNMTITTSGGTGDADLYVTFGQQSTQSQYNCRSWNNGNSESCTFDNPSAGTWYIDLYGYSQASNVAISLTANP